MLGPIHTFKNSIREIRKKKFSYFYMFFQLVCFSSLVRQFGTDGFLIFNLVFSFIVFKIKGKKLESTLFKIVLILLILFIIPVIYWNQLNIQLYIGFLIRIINGYLILRIFDDEFIPVFVNLIFLLSLISIPLFFIQIISPNFFNVFTNLSYALLSDSRISAGHKYLVVFLVNGWGENRNSGFMWEPAAFGGVLTWAIMFSLFQNKLKFNSKSYLMLFAMLTTFSLGTYLYILFIIIFYLTVKLRNFYQIIIPGSLIIILFFFSPFLAEMREMMEEKLVADQNLVEESMEYESEEQSRSTGMIISLKYFLKFPFGFGFTSAETQSQVIAASPNGFSVILVRWGILGIVIFLYSLLQAVRYLPFPIRLRPLSKFFAIICLALPFMGNPFYNQPLIFSLLILPFIYKAKYKNPNSIQFYNLKRKHKLLN